MSWRDWKPRPKRVDKPFEERNYTDIITRALMNAATDSAADGYVAALEIAAGQMSRAFASGSVEGPNADLFTPDVLARIGRNLVELGEAVYFRQGDQLVNGEQYGRLPDGRFQFSLPTGQVVLSQQFVLFATWNYDVNSQRGIAPLGTARNLRMLQQRLEVALMNESSAPVGYLLPLPADGDGANIAQLKQDLASLKGDIAIVETLRAGWGQGPQGAPRREFELARMGPDFPDSSVNLYESAQRSVLAACGYPIQLMLPSDGTSQREAWRRYLHGTVAPMGRIVQNAARRAGLVIQLRFDALFASDIQGRARAFQSLVGGGMEIERAAAVSGLLEQDDE